MGMRNGLAALTRQLQEPVDLCREDLAAYAARDPAANGLESLIITSYSSFEAVLSYRVAHHVLGLQTLSKDCRRSLAVAITDKAKLASGIEIHPGACIGERFVVDHGIGTVIGETSEIGDDCYILRGVTLGASGIGDNPAAKRHPSIGDRVEIGSCARLLGPISIGDDVFIGPNCVVTADIPSGHSVSILNQLQIHLLRCGEGRRLRLLALASIQGKPMLLGSGFFKPALYLLDSAHKRLETWRIVVTGVAVDHVTFNVRRLAIAHEAPRHLEVCDGGNRAVLLHPPGLDALLTGGRTVELAAQE